MKKMHILKLYLLILVLMISVSACSAKSTGTEQKGDQIKDVFLPNESRIGTVDFTLYFANDGKTAGVKAEERSVQRDELLGYVLLNELIKGPAIKSSLKPVLAPETKVLSFSIRDNIGYLSLDSESIKKMKMDKNQEKSTVQSIVNTLCQLPEVQKVQIMLDNQKQDTLSGTVDISKPLSPADFQ